MDFVTPVMFGVLIILAILVYSRLGHLAALAKEAVATKSTRTASSESSHRLRVFVINARKGAGDGILVVQQDESGRSLQSGIVAGSVKHAFINGGAFDVSVVDGVEPNAFFLKLTPSADKAPFAAQTNSGPVEFSDTCKQYYCMCSK